MKRTLSLALIALSLVSVSGHAQRGGAAGRGGAAAPPPLKFQFLGPASGGRVASIAGVAGDFKTWYMGAASGGVWKSTDSGSTFLPVFDKQDVMAIGSLATSQSDPNTVWAGTGEAWAIRDADVVGDGIYKSTDAGATWANMGLAATGRIGRILVHPTNPNIVFACALGRATGPQQERGVYRTTDGGKTWERVLFVDPNTGCSGLSLDPADPNTIVAGMWSLVMHTYKIESGGAGSGVFISHDGGTAWTRASKGLPNSPVGKVGVAIAPSNPKRIYALIETDRQGSLWRTDDGGDQWTVVSWARPLIGRAGYYTHVMVSPANQDEVLIAESSFWRSMDGGKTFTVVQQWGGDNHDIWWDPTNANHIGITNDLNGRMSWTHGNVWQQAALPIAQAYHVAIDNRTPYWIYTNRQDNSTMRGPSSAPEQPAVAGRGGGGVAMSFYGAAAVPVGGRGGGRGRGGAPPDSATAAAMRDSAGRGGAAAARPDSTGRGGAGRGVAPDSIGAPAVFGGGGGGGGGFGGGGPQFSTWDHNIGGCESGFTLPDLTNTDIVWASCYGNTVTRWDARTGVARSVSPWMHTLDWPPDQLKYRCHWTPPLAIDPFDHNTVYYGCQVVFKTSNRGQNWSVISPDLSTRDPSRVVSSGGLIPDNLGQFYGEVVFAIAPSEIQRNLIWAGTNDGKVWFTRDGATWSDVSKAMQLPAWGTVRKIEPSHFDPATAYVAVDYHMMDDRRPVVMKTSDFGKTWTNVTGDLPATHPLDYVMAVTENPNRKGMLFVGTGHGFFYTLDDGKHWTQFSDGLPAAPVSWVVVSKLYHDVVVSTYGRGIFVLRDISLLEQGDKTVADEPVHFYTTRTSVREPRAGSAQFNFTLKDVPKDSVAFEIADGSGKVIRTMKVIGRAGMNRATWDLRYDGPTRIDLRTLPPDNPHIWDEPRFRNPTPPGGRGAGGGGGGGNAAVQPAGSAAGNPGTTTAPDTSRTPKVLTRGITHWGIDATVRAGPLAAPGKYTVKISADGHVETQSMVVVRAFDIAAPDSDLKASTVAQIRIRNAMNDAADMANKLEIMRKQIEDLSAANATNPAIARSLRDLDKKMMDVELRILSRSDLNTDDKWYVEPTKLYLTLIWLSGEVGTGAGDVAGGADNRPTEASMETLGSLEKDLVATKVAYAKLGKDIQAFNDSMAGKLPPIVDKLVKPAVIVP